MVVSSIRRLTDAMQAQFEQLGETAYVLAPFHLGGVELLAGRRQWNHGGDALS